MRHKNAFGILVPVDSPVKSLADLKGKSVSVTVVGSSSDVKLLRYIRQQGMDLKRISRSPGREPRSCLRSRGAKYLRPSCLFQH